MVSSHANMEVARLSWDPTACVQLIAYQNIVWILTVNRNSFIRCLIQVPPSSELRVQWSGELTRLWWHSSTWGENWFILTDYKLCSQTICFVRMRCPDKVVKTNWLLYFVKSGDITIWENKNKNVFSNLFLSVLISSFFSSGRARQVYIVSVWCSWWRSRSGRGRPMWGTWPLPAVTDLLSRMKKRLAQLSVLALDMVSFLLVTVYRRSWRGAEGLVESC